jgi:hypothetical protein
MIDIKKLLEAVSAGCGDHCGCGDGDEARAAEWLALAESDNPDDHELLYSTIRRAAAYGG